MFGSYLTIVNDTPDVWQCKLGLNAHAHKIQAIMIGVLGTIALASAIYILAVPLVGALMTNTLTLVSVTSGSSFVHIYTSASSLVSMSTTSALAGVTATIVGLASGFTLALANGIRDELDKEGYNVILAKENYRYGKMPLSAWRQGECIKTMIVDEHTVRVKKVLMRPIFSGPWLNSNRNHSIQRFLDRHGTTEMTMVGTNATLINGTIPITPEPITSSNTTTRE